MNPWSYRQRISCTSWWPYLNSVLTYSSYAGLQPWSHCSMLWIGPPTCKKKCLYRSLGNPSFRNGAAIWARSSGDIKLSESVETKKSTGAWSRQNSPQRGATDSPLAMWKIEIVKLLLCSFVYPVTVTMDVAGSLWHQKWQALKAKSLGGSSALGCQGQKLICPIFEVYKYGNLFVCSGIPTHWWSIVHHDIQCKSWESYVGQW